MTGKTMTIEEAYSHCWDRHDYPQIIEDTAGLDITIPGYTTRIGKYHKSDKRRVKLDITTYGVEHFYGNLHADGINFLIIEDNGKTCSVWDSKVREVESKYPLANSTYDIELVRKVTEEEMIHSPSRWEGYYVGADTNAFYSPEEVIELAKQVFKARFKGDWYLEWDDLYTYETKTFEL